MNRGPFGPTQFQRETGVSRETLDRFQLWRDRLAAVNAHTNLVGRSTLDDFWFRHALDSWQVFQLAPEASRWADLGSGAGFPGLAIAFGLMDRQVSGAEVTLIESIGKKAAFLKDVAAQTGAPVRVLPVRVEALATPPCVDIVTARAMAPLPKLLGYVQPFVENGVVALLPKGRNVSEELTLARKSWTFESKVIPSHTDPEAAILEIRGLRRA